MKMLPFRARVFERVGGTPLRASSFLVASLLMSDGANVALVAAASALAGAKLQDIFRALLSRRRRAGSSLDRDASAIVAASPRATATTTPPRSPARRGVTRASIGGPPIEGPSTIERFSSSVLCCPRCDDPAETRDRSRANPASSSSGSSASRAGSKKPDPFSRTGRKTYLSWDDYFMSVAFLSAQRSKDPNKQVGAVIVGPERVICGVGYNGFPRGCADDHLPWAKKSKTNDPTETKYAYVCHAEMNAIMNKNAQSLRGATLYVTMYPCNECAKLVIQSGITEVVYFEGKNVEPADAAGGSSDAGGGGVSSAANGGPSSPRKELAAASGWRELEVGVTPGKAEPRTPTATRKGEETETNDRRGGEFSSLEDADAVGAEKPETPTKGGVRPNPAYFAAGKLLALANVKVRQHTPRATVGVTYG